MPRALKPVSALPRTTLTEAAFEQLIAYIVKGAWKAGDRIPPERELCQQFGIARTSLREALKAMELVGMVDSRVGDGTFVSPRSDFLSRPLLWAFTGTDHEELAEILEARMLVEESLAGLAAERGTEEEIACIKDTVTQMREALAAGNSILETDLAFHLAVARAAHNEVLRNAVQLLRNITRQWLSYKVALPNVAKGVLKRHQQIYLAISKGEGVAARAAMRKHLEEASRLVIQVVEKHKVRF